MRRYSFEPPTDHYDERLETIDEQICSLMNQRKDLSGSTPSFPTKQLISNWSKRYGFYEEYLQEVFSHFLTEEMFKPIIEPKGFLKNISVLKSFEKDEVYYLVTFIRQYKNASVVHLTIDREEPDEDEMHRRFREPLFFELSIKGKEADYVCSNQGGGGSGGHESFTYIVSPALPNDLSETELVFKKCKRPFEKATGFEFVISLDK